ncbi:M15 family metallopeptidase [Halobacillus litoralis]|uniref:M15 family metallopeptidase n=1 Tax=Halobacillus litoralis TaxID=45668 RepID=UPI001CD458E4|nr:M15 family metallopeptidase [Halobacillus litoralis]MCA0971944.1 M15 family metallopeptidase [Halobacillus litoralis]
MFPRIDPNPAPVVQTNTENSEETPLPTMLHPLVEKYKDDLVAQAEQKGIDVVITEGHRTEERQKKLYAQGRSTEGNIVTYAKAGESYHNYGLAIDFALRTEGGDVVWDTQRDDNGNGKADWLEVARIAKDMGFEWGGDWTNFKDYPHLQMDFGLTIRDLKRGERPQISEYADE